MQLLRSSPPCQQHRSSPPTLSSTISPSPFPPFLTHGHHQPSFSTPPLLTASPHNINAIFSGHNTTITTTLLSFPALFPITSTLGHSHTTPPPLTIIIGSHHLLDLTIFDPTPPPNGSASHHSRLHHHYHGSHLRSPPSLHHTAPCREPPSLSFSLSVYTISAHHNVITILLLFA